MGIKFSSKLEDISQVLIVNSRNMVRTSQDFFVKFVKKLVYFGENYVVSNGIIYHYYRLV